MGSADRLALVEQGLTRAAEQIGDTTAPAMALYYARYPEAKAGFQEHCLGNRPLLEGQMIENALYCLMYWFETPGEVEILLMGSVQHHEETLHVPPSWYSGLIAATADIVIDTIPAENIEEQRVWRQLRDELDSIVTGNPIPPPQVSASGCPVHRAN